MTADNTYMVAINYPWMDLERLREAEYIAAAHNLDTHKISGQEADVAFARAQSDFETAAAQRQAAENQSDAAINAENRSLMPPAPALPPAPAALPAAPPPPSQSQTTCQPFGTGVICNTTH